jgi:hypothetical protein
MTMKVRTAILYALGSFLLVGIPAILVDPAATSAGIGAVILFGLIDRERRKTKKKLERLEALLKSN